MRAARSKMERLAEVTRCRKVLRKRQEHRTELDISHLLEVTMSVPFLLHPWSHLNNVAQTVALPAGVVGPPVTVSIVRCAGRARNSAAAKPASSTPSLASVARRVATAGSVRGKILPG